MAFDFEEWGSNYPEGFDGQALDVLKEAFESGNLFDSNWHGFSDSSLRLRVARDEDFLTVEFHFWFDRLTKTDLFYDELTPAECENLSDEMISEIVSRLSNDGAYLQHITLTASLPANIVWDKMTHKANALWKMIQECRIENRLQRIGTTLYVLYHHPETDDFIKVRLEKIAANDYKHMDGE